MDHEAGVRLQLPPVPDKVPQPKCVQSIMAYVFGSVCSLSFAVAPAVAQSSAPPMPENESAKRYGKGWECHIGFRLIEETCNAVGVPTNAYETNRTYGPGWACLHGYRADDGNSCVEVIVPDGGFLGPSGERWHCSRGFLKVGNICQEIALPENAYLSDGSYRSGWKCELGFEVSGDFCAPISVPENAFQNETSFGQPWTCERGFFEQNDQCVADIIPMHAYFMTLPTTQVGGASVDTPPLTRIAKRSTSPRMPISTGRETAGNATGISRTQKVSAFYTTDPIALRYALSAHRRDRRTPQYRL